MSKENGKLLRSRKVHTDRSGTRWMTAAGGLFIEPVQRPDLHQREVTLSITLARADYKLLEVLHDDVAGYITRLVQTHAQGMIKSAKYNAEVKQNGKAANSNRNARCRVA